jgi:peptidoglycan/xylan/chitin deacetylase (PgdA/CDA1 family)
MKPTKIVIFLTMILSLSTTVFCFSSTRAHANEPYENRVAVLAYHHIAEGKAGPIQITPELFRDQLVYLKSKGIHFISYSEFKQFLAGGAIPTNAVLVTFDDGYESYYQYAYPILKELSVPAVNFVITKNLENPTTGALPSLSREEIHEMSQDNGQYSFQCHTDSLHVKQDNKPYLTNRLTFNDKQESEEEYEQRVTKDSDMCVSKLAELQTEPVDAIAYPFGSYTDTAIQLLQRSGLKVGFTVQPGVAQKETNPMKIPRINAGSPWVTPESLNELIAHQTVTFKSALTELPLRIIVEQLGGVVTSNSDQTITVYLNNKTWLIIKQKEAIDANAAGQIPVYFSSKLKLKNNSLYIRIKDLQKLVDKPISYDKMTKRFIVEAEETSE